MMNVHPVARGTPAPWNSDDLTYVIDDRGHYLVVLKSPNEAEHYPDYREVIWFLSRDLAEAYIRAEPADSLV